MAVTVRVHVPAGVPVWVPLEPPPPPHALKGSSSAIGRVRVKRNRERVLLAEPGKMTKPKIASTHSQTFDVEEFGVIAAVIRAVVVTVTVNFEAVTASTFSLAGSEHSAPLGAPVQVSDALPLRPPPPMESE